MTAPTIILILKAAVIAVTILLVGSMTALIRGNIRLHGRVNLVFFALTLVAVLGLEAIIRFISPDIFYEYLDRRGARSALQIHLGFSVPAAVLLFFMLFTGLKHHRTLHIAAGCLFLVLWTGTFITGVFFLPHQSP